MSAPTKDRADFDRRLFAPMIIGSILNPINSSIIAVSLVPIGRAFGAPPSQTAWLVSALYLVTAIGQPVVGRLVDTHGPRRLFLVGTSLTVLAGVVGTLAPQFWVLVAARVILGAGTCAGYPAAMYLIRSESRRTGKDSPALVLTALAVANQTISVIGPTLGGVLIGLGGWRTTFAINVPLGVAAFVLGRLRLPRATGVEKDTAAAPLDLFGIVTFAAMLTSLLLYLVEPHMTSLWLLAVSALAGVAFLRRERRIGTAAFIDVRVLAGNRPLVGSYVRTLLTQLISYSFLYGYTQWLEDGHGYGATRTGLVLLPMFAVAIGISAATGRSPRIQAKLVVAAATQVVACTALVFFDAGTPLWVLLALSLLLGLPQGLASLGNQNAVYVQADPARIASSAGLLRTFGYLGAIAAAAASGLFFGATADSGGLHELGLFTVGAAIAVLVLTLADRSLRRVGTREGATR